MHLDRICGGGVGDLSTLNSLMFHSKEVKVTFSRVQPIFLSYSVDPDIYYDNVGFSFDNFFNLL